MQNKKNKSKRQAATRRQASPQAAAPARKRKFKLPAAGWKWGFFALILIFCTLVYGDVFARAEQESLVLADSESMKFLTDKPFGQLFLVGRWMLLVFKNKWAGGLVLSVVLTATACQLSYLLRLPDRWRGLAFLIPLAELAWMVSQGTNLYYKSEPSRIVLLPAGVFLVLLLLSVVVRFLRKAPRPTVAARKAWPGYGMALAAYAGLLYYALAPQQNAILLARMQLRLWQQDWEGMVQDGLAARRASRAVTTYYAIGLLRQDRLVDELFNIPYNYPNNYLQKRDGSEEYGILQADADFEAGLVQPAYHYALEFTIMNGPTIYQLKRMAVSALLIQQKELARKYLDILSRVPLEGGFVDKYRPMLANPKLIEADEELAAVKKLLPQESRFEQNYRQPIFLGYNIGLGQGGRETLLTSIAACLYSKDLQALMPRLDVLQKQGATLPRVAQQAVACYALKHPEALQAFPINRYVQGELQAFLTDAAPYVKADKSELREALKEQWLGTYMYYYYCENNDSIATGKANQKGGVN